MEVGQKSELGSPANVGESTNITYLKISAVDPVRITEIGAHQAGMDHETFLRDRLGKKG